MKNSVRDFLSYDSPLDLISTKFILVSNHQSGNFFLLKCIRSINMYWKCFLNEMGEEMEVPPHRYHQNIPQQTLLSINLRNNFFSLPLWTRIILLNISPEHSDLLSSKTSFLEINIILSFNLTTYNLFHALDVHTMYFSKATTSWTLFDTSLFVMTCRASISKIGVVVASPFSTAMMLFTTAKKIRFICGSILTHGVLSSPIGRQLVMLCRSYEFYDEF